MVPSDLYSPSQWDKVTPLRQGEILSNLVQVHLDLDSLRKGGDLLIRDKIHPLALVLTQDCDLEQDYHARQKPGTSDKLLPCLLFCEIATADELFARVKSQGTKFWDRIRINKDERYHFLQKVEPIDDGRGEGSPEMGIDFKRYFTIPTDESYHRIATGEAKRRCCLLSPYLEHLCSRFAHYLSRVALPEDHFSEPPPRS